MELENMTITSNDVGPAMGLTNRALESDGIGAYLKATNMTIHMTGDSQIGAEVFGVAANQAGGVMELFNTNITMVGNNSFGLTNTYGTRLTAENTTVHMTGNSNGVVQANSSTVSLTNFEGTLIGNNSQVFGAFVGSAAGASKNALLEATGATITVEGDYNRFVYASTGATTKLTDSTISGTGINNYGLASRSTSTGANAAPSTITLLNTSVSSLGSGSSAAFVNNGSKLEIGGSKSIIEGQVNGIVITADANVLANGTNLISLTNQSLLKNLGVGDGEAAFKVGGADANITVTDSTVESGRTLLYVNETQIPLPVAPPGTPPTPGTHSSVVNLTADNSILNGDILVEAGSVANINLVNNSSLQGIINGANDVLVGDHSVWTTPNNSMLVGNLALQSGTLVVNSTAKFASSGQASVVTIGGNFSMNSASTLSLGIGGLNGSQYDHLLVGKNAEVAGTLNVSSLGGFHPANLNLFEIIRSGTTTSGARFATVNDGINNNPKLQRFDIYAPNGVALLYVAVTPPGPTPTANSEPEATN